MFAAFLLAMLPAMATGQVAERQLQAVLDGPGHALSGKVTTETTPLAQVRVYAYQMSDLSLTRVDTDGIGSFLFTELSAGLYKIIAVKSGFVPAVILLQRQTADTTQYIEVDLAPQDLAANSDQQGFWSLRKKIPSDVLRDLETLEMAQAVPEPGFSLAETRFQALTGTDDTVPGSGQMNRGSLGMSGSVGATDFDISGDHWVARGVTTSNASHSSALAVSVTNPESGDVRMASSDNRLDGTGGQDAIGLQRYQVSWSQRMGPGASSVKAEVLDEYNFFSSGVIQPAGLPDSSRSLNLEGSYEGAVIGDSSLSAGFRYRQVEGVQSEFAGGIPYQRVDLFGNGSMLVRPKFQVQYGLYSTIRDGSLSVVPQGGVVVQLGSDWTASSVASHKVHEDEPVVFDFMPVQYSGDQEGCQAEQACYQVSLSREFANKGGLSIGASHRQFDETLRLYFADDFFSHLESIYLVDGDQLPEVQVALSRRLSPSVMARLESSIASGGGGVLHAADSRSYENNVSYIVTSVDTLFESTHTGVLLAFHHLEQELQPLAQFDLASAGGDLEMQRLQLRLTQDLSALSLASLALRLNMEVTRGDMVQGLDQSDEEIRKRFMGGVAVTF